MQSPMGVFYAFYGHSSVAAAGPTLEYFLLMLRGGYNHLYWEEEHHHCQLCVVTCTNCSIERNSSLVLAH